jgi:hypothetical protein
MAGHRTRHRAVLWAALLLLHVAPALAFVPKALTASFARFLDARAAELEAHPLHSAETRSLATAAHDARWHDCDARQGPFDFLPIFGARVTPSPDAGRSKPEWSSDTFSGRCFRSFNATLEIVPPKRSSEAAPSGSALARAARRIGLPGFAGSKRPDFGSARLTLDATEALSWDCHEQLFLSTTENAKLVYAAADLHTKRHSFSIDFTSAQEADECAREGMQVYTFPCGVVGTALSMKRTAELLKGADARAFLEQKLNATFAPIADAALAKQSRDPRVLGIRSGDLLSVARIDGSLDPMTMWLTGSGAGHSAMALWDDAKTTPARGEDRAPRARNSEISEISNFERPSNATLWVVESTDDCTGCPYNATEAALFDPSRRGVRRTPWLEWVAAQDAEGYGVSVLPLRPDLAELFDEARAWRAFRDVEGFEYGYHSFAFGLFDFDGTRRGADGTRTEMRTETRTRADLSALPNGANMPPPLTPEHLATMLNVDGGIMARHLGALDAPGSLVSWRALVVDAMNLRLQQLWAGGGGREPSGSLAPPATCADVACVRREALRLGAGELRPGNATRPGGAGPAPPGPANFEFPGPAPPSAARAGFAPSVAALSLLATMPERDANVYPTQRYDAASGRVVSTTGPSLVCSALVAALWKAALPAGTLAWEAPEQAPVDNYAASIFDTRDDDGDAGGVPFSAKNCPVGLRRTPRGRFCQLAGSFVMDLDAAYNSVPAFGDLNERCARRWPDYVRCPDAPSPDMCVC